jgi:hypothetical protein
MTSPEHGSSSSASHRIARLRGWLPLNEESNPMATHGHGTLTNLIKSRSTASLHGMTRRPSSFVGREGVEDEETPGERDDPFQSMEERRASIVLNGPQMRSMRLIGNSNPRYQWRQYWKTEEELKRMKKPM